jgi:hypothetical protein
MKKSAVILISLMLVTAGLHAQNKKQGKVSRYETFVYTGNKTDQLIQDEYNKQGENTRGYLDDLGKAVLKAGKGVAGGYVTSVIDIGVSAVASLITRNANNKVKWEEAVKAENVYQETLTTVDPINDFYSTPSIGGGAMDPKGMNFDGIGCLRTIDGDTVFFVSCRIDPSKIYRIINHSKFELSLDALIIDPYHCNLPNSNFDTEFSFERRQNLQFTIEMRLISSWINEVTQLQKNQELGSFVINVPVSQKDLDSSGKLRYVRKEGEPGKYKITGESFIVPRSYMGSRDENNTHVDCWGTGDYRVELTLKETCNTAEAYRKDWKNDWKRRQDAEDDENFMQRSWKMISSQRWDDISKQWVITTLKAPANMVTGDLLKELDLAPGTGNNATKPGGGTTGEKQGTGTTGEKQGAGTGGQNGAGKGGGKGKT